MGIPTQKGIDSLMKASKKIGKKQKKDFEMQKKCKAKSNQGKSKEKSKKESNNKSQTNQPNRTTEVLGKRIRSSKKQQPSGTPGKEQKSENKNEVSKRA